MKKADLNTTFICATAGIAFIILFWVVYTLGWNDGYSAASTRAYLFP